MGSIPHKFPRTAHLWGSASTRDDRVLSEADTRRALAGPLSVEEKIDGANVGLSFSDEGALVIQNRGHYLSAGDHAQYGPLWPFAYERLDALFAVLGPHKILFGEWCFAKHSCVYDALPAYFVAFDLYDKRDASFADRAAVEAACEATECVAVPLLARGAVLRSTEALDAMIGRAQWGPGRAEGVYLRREEGGRVTARYKWVRKDFTAGITAHWNSKPLEPNKLARK
jgi:hypothetical protein